MLGVLNRKSCGADCPPNGGGVFRWLDKNLLLQQDLHPVYIQQQGESEAESPLHVYREGKAPWLIYGAAQAGYQRKLLCRIHRPRGEKSGLRAQAHLAGTEAVTRQIPNRDFWRSSVQQCENQAKTKYTERIKVLGDLVNFFPQNDYQSNYAP